MYIEGVKIIIDTKLKNQVVQYLETCLNNEYDGKLCYEIDKEESHKRGEPFSFAKCQIPVGSEIVYIHDESVVAKVIDDRKNRVSRGNYVYDNSCKKINE